LIGCRATTARGSLEEGDRMAETPRSSSPQEKEERIPVMQRVLDNPFLLLFIGVSMPAVLYLMWGIMEVAQIPLAK
jgi:hypothetical protein